MKGLRSLTDWRKANATRQIEEIERLQAELLNYKYCMKREAFLGKAYPASDSAWADLLDAVYVLTEVQEVHNAALEAHRDAALPLHNTDQLCDEGKENVG